MNEAQKSHRTDRAIGAVIGSAVGDALGSQYEFGPAHPDTFEPTFGRSTFGHGVGEWTDDTQMAMPILEELSHGASLNDRTTLGRILTVWECWGHLGRPTCGKIGLLRRAPSACPLAIRFGSDGKRFLAWSLASPRPRDGQTAMFLSTKYVNMSLSCGFRSR